MGGHLLGRRLLSMGSGECGASGQQNPSFFPHRAGRGGGPAPPQTDRQLTCKCRDGPWSACVCACTRMWCGLVCGVQAV